MPTGAMQRRAGTVVEVLINSHYCHNMMDELEGEMELCVDATQTKKN